MRIQYESLESTAQLFNVDSCGHWLGRRLVLLTLMVCTVKPELATETGNYKLDRVMIAECDRPLLTLAHIFLRYCMQVNHNNIYKIFYMTIYNFQRYNGLSPQSASKTLQGLWRKAFQ